MNAVFLIARRELAAYLKTMSGYVIIAAVLAVNGLFFNAFAMGQSSKLSAQVLHDFFFYSSGMTMIASIFISMRLLAEERQAGTLSLLYSSPVTDAEIVWGKFLSGLIFLAILTLCSVYLPLLILVNGKISVGHLVVGYTGLLLLGSASIAIGTFGSAVARSQVLAAMTSACILTVLLLSWWVSRVTDRPLTEIFSALAFHNLHFPPFQAGIIHIRDVVYYLAVTYVALFGATRVLEARRWR